MNKKPMSEEQLMAISERMLALPEPDISNGLSDFENGKRYAANVFATGLADIVKGLRAHQPPPSLDALLDAFDEFASEFSGSDAQHEEPDGGCPRCLNTEPVMHTEMTDGLHNRHMGAFDDLYCATCNVMVHAHNNEMMRPWVEYEKPYCWDCWTTKHCANGTFFP